MSNRAANRKHVKDWLIRNSNPEGVVYQLLNVVTGDSYIGSTRGPVKKRLWQLIAAANSGRNDPVYENIRMYGKESFEIKVLYSCEKGECLKTKENEYILREGPRLNKNFAKKDKNNWN